MANGNDLHLGLGASEIFVAFEPEDDVPRGLGEGIEGTIEEDGVDAPAVVDKLEADVAFPDDTGF